MAQKKSRATQTAKTKKAKRPAAAKRRTPAQRGVAKPAAAARKPAKKPAKKPAAPKGGGKPRPTAAAGKKTAAKKAPKKATPAKKSPAAKGVAPMSGARRAPSRTAKGAKAAAPAAPKAKKVAPSRPAPKVAAAGRTGRGRAAATPAEKAQPAAAPPAPSMADVKAKKTTRGRARVEAPAETGAPLFDAKQLQAIREKLLARKEEIVRMYRLDLRTGQESNDSPTEDLVDRANNAYSRELSYSISDSERMLVLQIDEALARVDEGSYGRCVHCGRPIAPQRLEALPWARHCIDCAELLEKGLLTEP